jgi:hypothetical protein
MAMSKEKIKRCQDSLNGLVKRLNFYEDQLKTMIHGMGLLLKDLNITKSEIATAMVTLKNNIGSGDEPEGGGKEADEILYQQNP